MSKDEEWAGPVSDLHTGLTSTFPVTARKSVFSRGATILSVREKSK